jgi:hypothetical protein
VILVSEISALVDLLTPDLWQAGKKINKAAKTTATNLM